MIQHIAVVGLGFGDEGKGTTVDYLCATRPVNAVVRFNGGAQAGHNVVMADGRHHTFAQWGSGTLRGVPTLLSRYMIFDPLAAVSEGTHLVELGVPDPWSMLSIDEDALVVTPYHKAVNQAREIKRGAGRHGSVGMGVGEAVSYALRYPQFALRVKDLRTTPTILSGMLRNIHTWAASQPLAVRDLPPVTLVAERFFEIGQHLQIVDPADVDHILEGGPCVFEGAQGVLLDESRGFHPYTTWSNCTFDNAIALAGPGNVYKLGVVRTYTTRHGAGPFVTEDPDLTAKLVDPYNSSGPWQGAFRVGHFDLPAHRYAIDVCGGIDGLALTHLDAVANTPELGICWQWDMFGSVTARLAPGPRGDLGYQTALTEAVRYAKPAPISPLTPNDWVPVFRTAFGRPVVLTSYGPTAEDKKEVTSDVYRGALPHLSTVSAMASNRS